jgi:hypothetical protein
MFPLTPVMLTGKVPRAAVPFAVTVMVERLVVGLGLKLALVPLGNPDALRETDPEKPLIGLTVTW